MHKFENCPGLKTEVSIKDLLTYILSCISDQLAKLIKKDFLLTKEI